VENLAEVVEHGNPDQQSDALVWLFLCNTHTYDLWLRSINSFNQFFFNSSHDYLFEFECITHYVIFVWFCWL